MAFINGKEILFSSEINLTVVDVTQETGESKTAVMSQKSVTEELIKRDNDISRTNKRIENLEDRISPSMFKTDSDVAYIKDVPANACPYAEVSKIGGMTRKTENLIPTDYDDGTSKTQNGLTFTVREDGAVVINGTQSGVASFNFKINNFVLEAGTYTLSGAPENAGNARLSIKDNTGGVVLAQTNGAKSGTFTLTERMACTYLQIYVLSGTQTFNKVVFKPMLNLGETAKPYSKRFEGLRDTKVTAIKSIGANLIPYPYAETETTIKGVTFTVNGDGTVTANGTAEGTIYYRFAGGMIGHAIPMPNWLEVGKTYTYSLPADTVGYVYFYKASGESASYSSTWLNTFTVPEGYDYFGIFGYIAKDTTVSNLTFKPMLCRGETVLDYAPYRERTLAIPAYVQSLPGYGEGVNEAHHNYIDSERKVFVRRTKRIVFNGTENWQLYDASGKYRLTLSITETAYFVDNNTVSSCICNLYNAITNGQTYLAKRGVSVDKTRIFIYDENYQEVTGWKAHLAELYANGTPLTIEYALATPIETPISSYLTDEFIEVEGNGILKFENEEALAVPSEISYMLKGATE